MVAMFPDIVLLEVFDFYRRFPGACADGTQIVIASAAPAHSKTLEMSVLMYRLLALSVLYGTYIIYQ